MNSSTTVVSETISQALADYACSTSHDAIPTEVRERARLIIVDEMASSCFGGRSIAGGLAARYAESFAGACESSILGSGAVVPAPLAALANGTAGHGEEVDGAHVVGGHPGATIVSAAVAVAEKQRSTGAELLNAVVLGYDIGTRIVQACGGVFGVRDRLHLHSDFLYALGAAAASARLLGVDAAHHRYALSLATFQSNGLFALFQENRHISKSFGNGQYAAAGVNAALMAAMGFEGAEDIVGGTHGLLEAWGIDDGAQAVRHGLGDEYAVMSANFKFVNAGYPIHAAVEAAMGLITDNSIRPDDISAIDIGMPRNAMRVVSDRDMHNICVQDMVSAAIVRRGLSIREVPFPAILADPGYHRIRALVRVSVDPELDRDQPNGRGARATLTLHSGDSHSLLVRAPRGHSSRGGVTWAELSGKWHDGLPDRDVDRIIALGRDLDSLDDVTTLTGAFSRIR
ncbi:MmgE/PrpD family protein [Nocardia sp. NPDC058518]|uniref:MmgE/PrpD family protein n=1 Tax=Nocardia sp. NPDC058518 TaxID=3346534 RepID=UPI00365DD2A9